MIQWAWPSYPQCILRSDRERRERRREGERREGERREGERREDPYYCTHSPNNSTAVTDTSMATISFVILLRNIGMDSTAIALANNRVTNNR